MLQEALGRIGCATLLLWISSSVTRPWLTTLAVLSQTKVSQRRRSRLFVAGDDALFQIESSIVRTYRYRAQQMWQTMAIPMDLFHVLLLRGKDKHVNRESQQLVIERIPHSSFPRPLLSLFMLVSTTKTIFKRRGSDWNHTHKTRGALATEPTTWRCFSYVKLTWWLKWWLTSLVTVWSCAVIVATDWWKNLAN